MNVTPLAIHSVILLEPRYSETDRGFFRKLHQQNVTLVATMRRNTNVTLFRTIWLSASRGPSTANGMAQLFCVSELPAEAVGNCASPLERLAGSVCEERGTISSRIVL